MASSSLHLPSSSSSGTIELDARGIDLTTALIEAASSPNKIINLAIELGHWLGREKLNRFQLEDFIKKSRDLNKKAEAFYDEVMQGEKTPPIANLALKQSGSLGRLMVRDPWLSWIVSTTACLFECHRENYVSETLCMILIQGSVPSDSKLDLRELKRHPSRIQLKAVADKLVLSVWFNVVNSGNCVTPLPESVSEVCSRGHNLASEDLAIIINELRAPRQSVIIQSTHLLLDLTRWLLMHFDGDLQVIVNSKIVYKASLGSSGRKIELRVDKYCTESCDDTTPSTYSLLVDISGSYKELWSGRYKLPHLQNMQPVSRQRLYSITRTYPPESKAATPSLHVAVKSTAQEIVSWLLTIPLMR